MHRETNELRLRLWLLPLRSGVLVAAHLMDAHAMVELSSCREEAHSMITVYPMGYN
jgi:hypothetical protein